AFRLPERSCGAPLTGAKGGHLRFKARYWPTRIRRRTLKQYERGSTKKPGEKRNDQLAKCRCRARLRAVVARGRGPWAGRRSAARATSRTQRGDEQVLPVPYRCDVSRPAAGSPRMGGRDLSHDRTRRVVDARGDPADGRLPRQRFRAGFQAGERPIEIIAAP